MKKTILAVLAALPLAALAQGAPPPPPKAGAAPAAGQPGPRQEMPGPRQEMMEKRAELARVLGLATILDLDSAQALKLRDALAKLDDRRDAAHRQLADARATLRDAARNGKASAQQVDEAVRKAQDARAQLDAIQRESYAAVSKDLSPEKRARAFMFLSRFESRFGPGMMRGGRGMGPGRGMGAGPGGPGPGMHRGPGGMGMGMGPGATGMGPGPNDDGPLAAGTCPGCPFDDDDAD
jgi:hypothetical protein